MTKLGSMIFNVYVKKSLNVKLGINISAFLSQESVGWGQNGLKKAHFRYQIRLYPNKYVLEQLPN